MAHESIRVQESGHVVTVTIDRPESRNACTMPMWLALRDTFREIAVSGARAVVLTGANGNFCSGAEIGTSSSGEGFTKNHLTNLRMLGDSVATIHACPVPVIAKVDGICVGAGLGLALAADLLYCSDRARFSAIFAKVGLCPDYGTSWLLTQRVGLHKAKEVTFTAEMMSAARAVEVGFVNGVVPAEGLDAKVDEVAGRIAAGPPIALSMSKRLLENASSSSLAHALESEALAQNVNLGTGDMKEAFLAFREKRSPAFVGR